MLLQPRKEYKDWRAFQTVRKFSSQKRDLYKKIGKFEKACLVRVWEKNGIYMIICPTKTLDKITIYPINTNKYMDKIIIYFIINKRIRRFSSNGLDIFDWVSNDKSRVIQIPRGGE